MKKNNKITEKKGTIRRKVSGRIYRAKKNFKQDGISREKMAVPAEKAESNG